MRKSLMLIILLVLQYGMGAFAQRAVTHTISGFTINYTTDKYSFDIYSKSTGSPQMVVGLTDYDFNINSTYMSNPTLTNVNSKFTSGSPTGDYQAMTTNFLGGDLIVHINFSDDGTGSGPGDLLSTVDELICTVTLDFTEISGQFVNLTWDEVNTGMVTPGVIDPVTQTLVGSDIVTPLPVELSSFTVLINQNAVNLNWQTKTEVDNYGFEIERKVGNRVGMLTGWEKIGFVSGHGNSNSPKDYTFVDKNPIGGSKFIYRLKQIDNDGKYEYSKEVEVELVPNEYALYQNYPNPFNPATNIKFALPNATKVTLLVYNLLGEKVATLLNEDKEAGFYDIQFNAKNLSTGVYIYRLTAGSYVQTKKMTLMK